VSQPLENKNTNQSAATKYLPAANLRVKLTLERRIDDLPPSSARWPGLKHLIRNAKAITTPTHYLSLLCCSDVDFNDITLGVFLRLFALAQRNALATLRAALCLIHTRVSKYWSYLESRTASVYKQSGRVAQEQSGQLHRPGLNFHYTVADNDWQLTSA
jgi:hypothetical protein